MVALAMLTFQSADGTVVTTEYLDGEPCLIIAAAADQTGSRGFVGEASSRDGHPILVARCTSTNAKALRSLIPWLRPVLLGSRTSVGMGDRLGLATPGHIAAVRATGGHVAPIFAQQSIREMARTGREPQQVLDDAMWAVFTHNWQNGYGADADHLKTTADIDRCLSAGFSFFTIDPSAHVDSAADTDSTSTLVAKLSALPWEVLESSPDDLLWRYSDRSEELETRRVVFTSDLVTRAAVKYGAAVAHVALMYRHLAAQQAPFELEISVDETDTPTSHAEHLYIVQELQRLGVQWVSLAPRYTGDFEKGVEYGGDLQTLAADLSAHAEIARAYGDYKLSLHSGSDKFSVYPLIAELTRGRVHLKTAGTSYLEALRVLAVVNPTLFRAILALAAERYPVDRASYHVSADLARLPKQSAIADNELPSLLEQHDARQILHVTFGSVLAESGVALRDSLRRSSDLYATMLERHFVRHLAPLAAHVRETASSQ